MVLFFSFDIQYIIKYLLTETSRKQYVLWTLDCRCFPRLRLEKHRQSLVHKTYCFPRSQSISVNCSLVRPILEYACNLWSPYTAKHRKLIENVQRRATKFILNYPQDLNYADRLTKIKMLPLEFRRDICDLCVVFKSRNGAITMLNHPARFLVLRDIFISCTWLS